MSRRLCLTILVLALCVTPVHGQFFGPLPVIDVANLGEAIVIAQRAQQHLEELQQQYRTILRMAQALGNMDRYRIPGVVLTGHDPAR